MTLGSRITALRYKTAYNSLLWLNKNNKQTQSYQEQGLNLLREKVESLPDKIAFRPKLLKQSFCVKVFNQFYIFISKCNLTKPISERFDSLFHEVGHWLHFQNLPQKEERRAIWSEIDNEKIKQDVSERAIQNNEGLEFVAEVFKGLVKGYKYDNYIMNYYKRLNGPKVKTK